ncbi:apolipoprotein N-acyltransferase [Legionella spiritensis]|uniref:Apolipoprotein N-acyltransferase n=1 Tax=Legionella spiritensis TaxID=452 RepID=A0A0W0Z5Y0_LEGSP|nr:apolipoprotein N-acyltransferase [Legionella spiritensis]KTD64118.1 apolipoprotein N-acyltransferase [Legionella spiritensis]SNV37919.1 apolipoprotein N-acyltransferase [Legionella spiritensis]
MSGNRSRAVKPSIKTILRFSEDEKPVRLFFRFLLTGLLLPLGFAPFHLPGMAILSLALFYCFLQIVPQNRAFRYGLAFGLGFFGFGVSWVFNSIHQYGHLNTAISTIITLFFILYLSLFPALMALVFRRLPVKPFTVRSGLAFSAMWIISEFVRATFLTGFPWLLVGFGQFDAPSRYLLPVLGVYGLGFLTCFSASLLVIGLKHYGLQRVKYLVFCMALLLAPSLMKSKTWSTESAGAISVGIIQANLSMRDKWDESLFEQLLNYYQHQTEQLLGTQLIVMPESAIPLPSSYVSDFLNRLRKKARQTGSAILLGIPKPVNMDEERYYNALITLGKGKGSYLKQHLVPFGEYIPGPFVSLVEWLGIPDANMQSGKKNQPLIHIQNRPVASLICYELAYGNLLRNQLPRAEWLVSISDDGWFGHSLAIYQQQQMAQVRSLQTSRYQVMANNDGLSSIIDNHGEIISSVPAFRSGILKTSLYPMKGTTLWVTLGDTPILIFSVLIGLMCFLIKQPDSNEAIETIAAEDKRRYPYQPV